jgi:hypothetical protein
MILILPFLGWLHLVRVSIIDEVFKVYDATIFRCDMCTMDARRKITLVPHQGHRHNRTMDLTSCMRKESLRQVSTWLSDGYVTLFISSFLLHPVVRSDCLLLFPSQPVTTALLFIFFDLTHTVLNI